MILFELTGTEQHPVYQELAIANVNRHYDFLRSIVAASIQMERPFLSQHIIKALNFHAITCLHSNAGEYRPWFVEVGDFRPPEHYRVQPLMDDFVNYVNRWWDRADPFVLSSFVLWRLNYIHPFINGNGRTARAASYFVLCVKAGRWLEGDPILPVMLSREYRNEYVQALKAVDKSASENALDLTALQLLLTKLVNKQLGEPVPEADVVAPTENVQNDALSSGEAGENSQSLR